MPLTGLKLETGNGGNVYAKLNPAQLENVNLPADADVTLFGSKTAGDTVTFTDAFVNTLEGEKRIPLTTPVIGRVRKGGFADLSFGNDQALMESIPEVVKIVEGDKYDRENSNNRGSTMSALSFKTTQGTGPDDVLAAVTPEQVKAIGLPEDAKYTFAGKRDASGNVTLTDMIISDQDGKVSTKIALTSPRTGRMNGDNLEFDTAEAAALVANQSKVMQGYEEFRKAREEAEKAAAADTSRGATDAGRGGDGTTPPAAGGEKGFMENAGEFVDNNKFGLGAGLMVGLLAAAMGGGGIMALILGLLAAVLIGGMLGMDKNGVMSGAKDGAKKDEPEKGKGLAIKKDGAPGPENAIDVKEREEVKLVKMDGTKKTYLSGQDKDGNLQYSDTATEITLRTQDENGKYKSLIKGKMVGNDFITESAATTLPDGRMGPMAESVRNIQLDSNGKMDLNGPPVTEARRPAEDAAAAYAKPQEIALTSADGRVSADYGKVTVGDKEYTAVVSGTMSENGKKATFDRAMLRDGDDNFVKGTDGNPIDLALPNIIALSVQDKKITPMTGDIKIGSEAIATEVLKEQKKQVDAKEAADSKRATDTVAAVSRAETNESQKATLRELFSERLTELGITDPNQRAIMSSSIANTYMIDEFRRGTAEQARTAISGMVGADDKVKAEMGDFAARIQEGVAKAMNDKASPASASSTVTTVETGATVAPAVTPSAPAAAPTPTR